MQLPFLSIGRFLLAISQIPYWSQSRAALLGSTVEGVEAADSWRFAALRVERRTAPEFALAGPLHRSPVFADLETASPTVADVIFHADSHLGSLAASAATCLDDAVVDVGS